EHHEYSNVMPFDYYMDKVTGLTGGVDLCLWMMSWLGGGGGVSCPSGFSSELQVLLCRDVFKKDELGLEIAQIAIPAALALMADPIASLIDTSFIGHLVSVTTSFVAEENAVKRENDDDDAQIHRKLERGDCNGSEMEVLHPKDSESMLSSADSSQGEVANSKNVRRNIPSASTAMVIGALLGLIQALFLICNAKPILNYMGVGSDSPMLKPAMQYLTLRSLGAAAILLSLAMQGDTKTPLYATVIGDVANIILDPILVFVINMGVSGAAIAHVVSQQVLWLRQVHKLPVTLVVINARGFLLLLRVIAATFCVTLAASLAARHGSTSMAAFQICLQIWLATWLLADGLAVAGQAILANAFARKDHEKAVIAASLWFGSRYTTITYPGVTGSRSALRLLTKDINVLQLISLGIPFVAVTQPINALAFVFDGINYGASDFAYAAYSMASSSCWGEHNICLLFLSSFNGLDRDWNGTLEISEKMITYKQRIDR
ncbi:DETOXIFICATION 42-like protein, partial [Drosera capensis]